MVNDPDESIEFSCSLTDAELRERRAVMGKRLLPHVSDCRLTGLQLVLEFSNSDELRADVEEFIGLERQCCGFLKFTLSPPGEKLALNIEGPEGSQSTLNIFASAVSAGG